MVFGVENIREDIAALVSNAKKDFDFHRRFILVNCYYCLEY